MKFIADLHIHSHFSRATSKNLTFEHLARWAQLKGVHVVATGDIAHPGWLAEMKDKLIAAEEGLYRLKDEYAHNVQAAVPAACQAPVRFILGGEISNIYKRDDRTRKVHNVVFAPSFEIVERLQARLEKIGNIRADGRPILGLDSRHLLETLLLADPRCRLIPAHIWTPWFSLLGSKSGFDSVEACFGDLTSHIFALETGLSSDPAMNWRVSQLDNYTLVSNSDAHSPEKLAREATLFDAELSYPALFAALETGDRRLFLGTVEFFPEEGKYHLDGHRNCGVVWDPPTTISHRGICTGCGKEVTVGVMHRVEELADRPEGGRPARTLPYSSLIPLSEVLGEVYRVGPTSKQVEQEYHKLLARLGPELFILRDAALEDIRKAGGERLAEGIGRMRRGAVSAQAGYDGEYGVIRLFAAPGAAAAAAGQIGLFAEELLGPHTAEVSAASVPLTETDVSEGLAPQSSLFDMTTEMPPPAPTRPAFALPGAALLAGLNIAQRAAVQCLDTSLSIVAGPGTGKTRTLTHRIAYLILERNADPASVLAITFTNKAADEMRERLAALLGPISGAVTVKTFHALGAHLLRAYGVVAGIAPDFGVCTEDDRTSLIRLACPELSAAEVGRMADRISAVKNGLIDPAASEGDGHFADAFARYEIALGDSRALDFDDLLLRTMHLLQEHPEVLAEVQQRYRWISVDEYQDVNAIQVRLLRLLTGDNANLCVIGDPDQAIYGFRGADRSHFTAFSEEHPEARLMRLSENYRSTPLILDAAVQVVAAGGAVQPSLRAALTDFAEQVKLDVHAAPTDRAEAEYVVHQIEQMVGGTSYFSLDSRRTTGENLSVARSFADFAVLYRLGAQSGPLIEAFERSGIPYQTTGAALLSADGNVRHLLAHLWLLRNPLSRLHLSEVLRGGKPALPPAVADRVTSALQVAGGVGRTKLMQILQSVAEDASLAKSHRKRLLALSELYGELARPQPVLPLVERVCRFLALPQEGRVGLLKRKAEARGHDLPGFLEDVALHSETDIYDPRADRVTLMTLHAAKGLEFGVVFIVGCEEGLLPYRRPGAADQTTPHHQADIEEERRLFYVGLTRARQRLILLHARKRLLYGREMQNSQSRFVDDIAAGLKELSVMPRGRVERKSPTQLELF